MNSLIALAAAAWWLTLPSEAVGPSQFVDTRMEASDTLRDAAVTIIHGGRATIRYNPALLSLLGPGLTDFVLAHEYGHAFYGHSGGALLAGQPDFARLRVRQELEADCYAASRLAVRNPAAVRAAMEFFSRCGPVRFDRVHPSGEQRAAVIRACSSAGPG
jgi:hypothetical protein